MKRLGAEHLGKNKPSSQGIGLALQSSELIDIEMCNNGFVVEKNTELLECHCCGKKKNPYFKGVAIWFNYLCQHFVGFCNPCFKKFGKEMIKYE